MDIHCTTVYLLVTQILLDIVYVADRWNKVKFVLHLFKQYQPINKYICTLSAFFEVKIESITAPGCNLYVSFTILPFSCDLKDYTLILQNN